VLKVKMNPWIVISLALPLMGCGGEETPNSTGAPEGIEGAQEEGGSETTQEEGGGISPVEDAGQQVTPGDDGGTTTTSDTQTEEGPGDTVTEADGASQEDGAGQGPVECDETLPALASPYFTDISESSGIQKNNYVSMPGKTIPINDHSRLAFGDINGDGLDDIVMHSLFPNPQAGIPFEHLVFLNNGDGTFEDFSDESGLRHYQVAFFAFGDLDNDGDQDIFGGLDIPLGSSHEVLLNDGTGKFLPVAESGFESEWNTSAGTALIADFNGDANLDIFIGNGQTSSAAPDSFWLGNGDGSFSKATSALQGSYLHPSNGSVACDYDNDGDLDIFVSTYGVSVAKGHNILWENEGGTFTNVAMERGFAAQEGGNYWLSSTGNGSTPEGVPQNEWMGSNGFGIACEDLNGDGWMDIYLATISHPVDSDYSRKWSDPSQVLINQGPESGFKFQNQFQEKGLPFNEGDIDAAAIDFDNDGRMDLAVTRDSKYEKAYEGDEQKSWFGLFHQQEDGTFVSTLEAAGINKLDFEFEASLDPCTGDETCPNGEVCWNDKCRTPCQSNNECPSAYEICHFNGFCKGLAVMKKGQNQSWADIDADGDMDLLVGGRDNGGGRPNFLFQNNVGQDRRWLGLRLVGDGEAINRDGIGATVTIAWDGGQLVRTVQGSRGTYNSADGRALLFGLGIAPCEYTVTVRWPNGESASFEAGSMTEKRYHTLTYPNILGEEEDRP